MTKIHMGVQDMRMFMATVNLKVPFTFSLSITTRTEWSPFFPVGKFLPTRRTPGISTSDLLARLVSGYRHRAWDKKLEKMGLRALMAEGSDWDESRVGSAEGSRIQSVEGSRAQSPELGEGRSSSGGEGDKVKGEMGK